MPVLPVNKIEANGCKSRTPPSNSMNNFIAKHQVNQIKYQYSFTDSLSFVEEAAFKVFNIILYEHLLLIILLGENLSRRTQSSKRRCTESPKEHRSL
jgi:hypothetical protein